MRLRTSTRFWGASPPAALLTSRHVSVLEPARFRVVPLNVLRIGHAIIRAAGKFLFPSGSTSTWTLYFFTTASHERSQGLEVLNIFMEILGFWGLQAARGTHES